MANDDRITGIRYIASAVNEKADGDFAVKG
jgi:hypothetical protein